MATSHKKGKKHEQSYESTVYPYYLPSYLGVNPKVSTHVKLVVKTTATTVGQSLARLVGLGTLSCCITVSLFSISNSLSWFNLKGAGCKI